mmetsp:Transcript_8505/g.21924  ORF Transcript_8505/g.21924 Transcript_8505/m.21924 type:complete len:280 (+) Transcript_8505:1149-1988(+)
MLAAALLQGLNGGQVLWWHLRLRVLFAWAEELEGPLELVAWEAEEVCDRVQRGKVTSTVCLADALVADPPPRVGTQAAQYPCQILREERQDARVVDEALVPLFVAPSCLRQASVESKDPHLAIFTEELHELLQIHRIARVARVLLPLQSTRVITAAGPTFSALLAEWPRSRLDEDVRPFSDRHRGQQPPQLRLAVARGGLHEHFPQGAPPRECALTDIAHRRVRQQRSEAMVPCALDASDVHDPQPLRRGACAEVVFEQARARLSAKAWTERRDAARQP